MLGAWVLIKPGIKSVLYQHHKAAAAERLC